MAASHRQASPAEYPPPPGTIVTFGPGFRLRGQAAVAGCLGILHAELLVEPALPRAELLRDVHDHSDFQPTQAVAVIAA